MIRLQDQLFIGFRHIALVLVALGIVQLHPLHFERVAGPLGIDLEIHTLRRLHLDDQQVGRKLLEGLIILDPRQAFELHHNLGARPVQALACPDIDGHPAPAEIVHMRLKGDIGGHAGGGIDPLFFPVARHPLAFGILPQHDLPAGILAAKEPEGFERLHLLIPDGFGLKVHRRLHGDERQHLHEVVLQHILENAGLLVIRAPPLHPQGFSGGNLDVVHMVMVPQRLKEGIAKADGQDVADHLLAQVMVDAVNLALLQGLGNTLVQFPGAGQVRTKRLFDHHPVAGVALPGQAVVMQVPDHRAKMLRRHRQEEQAHHGAPGALLGLLQVGFQPLVAVRLFDELHLVVVQALHEPGQLLLIHLGAGVRGDGGFRLRPVCLVVPGLAANGNHPGILRQAPFRHQVIKCWQEFPVGQIPRASKNQHRQPFPVGRSLAVHHIRTPFPMIALSYPAGSHLSPSENAPAGPAGLTACCFWFSPMAAIKCWKISALSYSPEK